MQRVFLPLLGRSDMPSPEGFFRGSCCFKNFLKSTSRPLQNSLEVLKEEELQHDIRIGSVHLSIFVLFLLKIPFLYKASENFLSEIT